MKILPHFEIVVKKKKRVETAERRLAHITPRCTPENGAAVITASGDQIQNPHIFDAILCTREVRGFLQIGQSTTLGLSLFHLFGLCAPAG